MSNRMTREVLNAKCDNVNRLLGFPDPKKISYNTEGALKIAGAYGGYRIETTTSGGCSPVGGHGYGTMREAALVLDGMSEALRLVGHKPAVVEPRMS